MENNLEQVLRKPCTRENALFSLNAIESPGVRVSRPAFKPRCFSVSLEVLKSYKYF